MRRHIWLIQFLQIGELLETLAVNLFQTMRLRESNCCFSNDSLWNASDRCNELGGC